VWLFFPVLPHDFKFSAVGSSNLPEFVEALNPLETEPVLAPPIADEVALRDLVAARTPAPGRLPPNRSVDPIARSARMNERAAARFWA